MQNHTSEQQTNTKQVHDGMNNDVCDLEVQYFMQDYIKQDKCICRKYSRSSSSKICPYCLRSRTTVYKKLNTNNHEACSPFTNVPPKIYTTEARYRQRSHRKRKPKLIPATDYIATYYFPYLMRYENLTFPTNKINSLLVGGGAKETRTLFGLRSSEERSIPTIEASKQTGLINDDCSCIINEMSKLSV